MKAAWILMACALATVARAELPPSVYEAKQKAAPEALRIQVLRVNIEPGDNDSSQKVEVLARVDEVTRSEAGIKPQDMITIVYTINHHPAGWAGPGEVPILEEGKSMVAYLKAIP